MTTERLEELAEWCDRQKETLRFHQITDIADHYADLARCARAWAKVERQMQQSSCAVELFGYRGRPMPWAWYTGIVMGKDRFAGPTAIEAVEAAEVT